MMLNLLHARRESKVKDQSTAHLKQAKMATAAKRKAIRSLISLMTTKMRTVMTLSKLRRKEDAVANAEVEEAVVAEVVVDSTAVIMIMSNVGVAIDPSLLLMMKRNLGSRQQLLHPRRKKLRLRFLPKNSRAGTLLFSNEILAATTINQAFFSNKSIFNTLNI
jgi:hypothetical protein